MTDSTSQRPFWTNLGGDLDANDWPIRDLAEWLRVTQLQPGFACQVLWRERTHCSYRHHNERTPQAAADFARSLMRALGPKLYDLGITANQPIAWTEFEPCPQFEAILRVRRIAADLMTPI
jgi:hypothetical protein